MSEETKGRARRRLAAVLVAGLRPLFPGDERDSFARLRFCLTEIIVPLVSQFDGSIFKQTGDLVLSEFGSVVEAVRSAAALREAMVQHNQNLPNEQRIAMSIGINLGDVIAEGGDILGDGVNIAARLEALAEPGSIFVSGTVHHHIADKVDFEFEDLGRHELKNISRPVRVYRIGGDEKVVPEDSAAVNPAVAVSPSAVDNRRAIAVLPFANFSGDPEQEIFAEGITEDIIALLAGWRAFPVIARASTINYKGKPVDIKKVGEELGVRYVLEGSVRKSGRRLRVTAQLIRADTGHHLMADRYDRDLADLFELQDEIVTAIAARIERGMFHHYRQNKADNIEAQSYFRRALAIDPQYVQAAAALSIALCAAAYLSWSDNPEQNYEESFELAQRAAALDRRYPNAHFALALICMWTARSDRAMAEFQEAIELNPSFAAAHAVLGAVLNSRGQSDEAVASVERGIRLSPSDPRLFIWLSGLAAAHYQLRHYAQAIEIGRRSWTLNHNYITGLTYVIAGLAQLGQIDEARATLATLKEFDPNLVAVRMTLERVYTYQPGIDHLREGLCKAGFE